MAHYRKPEEEKGKAEVTIISMDYMFMSEKDEKAFENPVIVMVDEETGDKFARAAGAKGLPADHKMDWVVKAISQ